MRVNRDVWVTVDWMMQFTFAHEFAHYLLGYLDLDVGNLSDEIAFPHKVEFDADSYAITATG